MTSAEEFINDLEKAKDEIFKLQQSNIDKVKALAQLGKTLDPGAMANLKVDTFIQTFLDETSQLVYVRNFEVEVRKMLDDALSTVRQEQLVQGVNNTSGKSLFIPR